MRAVSFSDKWVPVPRNFRVSLLAEKDITGWQGLPVERARKGGRPKAQSN